MTHDLVIGYGNEGRGDDAAGPEVARRIAAFALPNVQTIEARQLTPELAEEVALATRVYFVDAALEESRSRTVATRLEPSIEGDFVAHSLRPEQLLALARAIYGRSPPAWMVGIEARDFSPNAPLSRAARRGVVEAAGYLTQELQQKESR